jgi:hypothetical protein
MAVATKEMSQITTVTLSAKATMTLLREINWVGDGHADA